MFFPQVTLTIERHYGSSGSLQVRYITFSGTALGGMDYQQIEPGAFGAVNMDAGQTTAQIFIDVSQADLGLIYFCKLSFPNNLEPFSLPLTLIYVHSHVNIGSLASPFSLKFLQPP